MTGYEPQDARQDAATPGALGDPVTGLTAPAAADVRPRPTGEQKGQSGQTAQMAKEKAAQYASKARDMATSDETKPVRRRSGMVAAVGAAAVAVWAIRRRRQRNLTPMQKLARRARTQADIGRGQARAAKKMAKAAGARTKAKAAKAAKEKMKAKGRR